MDSKKNSKNPTVYNCTICSFITKHKGDYNKHLLTAKHINLVKYGIKPQKIYICDCGKEYTDRHNLYRHKKKCNLNIEEPVKMEEYINIEDSVKIEPNININMIIDIIKDNQEFKKLLLEQTIKVSEQTIKITEQNNQVIELHKENNILINKFIEREPMQIINNTNNNNQINNNQKFNLNIFLNETCKDAMNVNEFLDNLNPTVKDLEDVGEKGFVRGISDIILKSLRELDITKRPIHCTDIKREIVYLKENNIWSKDDNNNSRMKDIVRNVEDKNYFNIGKWQMEHPETRIMDSVDNLKHEKLIDVSCYAMYKEDKVRGKVIKELLKDIHIHGK